MRAVSVIRAGVLSSVGGGEGHFSSFWIYEIDFMIGNAFHHRSALNKRFPFFFNLPREVCRLYIAAELSFEIRNHDPYSISFQYRKCILKR